MDAKPPYTIIAGKGPVPLGAVIVTVKEMDLPASAVVMVSVVPLSEAVTDEGLGGITPSSYRWKSWLISALRQAQSALLTTLAPLKNVNGSGSLVLFFRVMLAGRAAQEAAGVPTVVVDEGAVGVVTGVVVVAGGVVVAVPLRHYKQINSTTS
jgi:hypothetical protein